MDITQANIDNFLDLVPIPDFVIRNPDTVFRWDYFPVFRCLRCTVLPDHDMKTFIFKLSGAIKKGGYCIVPDDYRIDNYLCSFTTLGVIKFERYLIKL